MRVRNAIPSVVGRFVMSTGVVAALFAIAFWSPLITGGGFIGGDVYSYYMPQKSLYADALQNGQLPFWNHLTGLGYPVLGESQTGVFYPPHWICYRFLELNTAYNAIHLVHYWGAFVFCALFARRLGINALGCWLAALVYCYSWFPTRNCWEWAIIGGCWLPAVLWAIEGWLARRRRLDLVLVSLFVGVALLAGHFNMAFITLLTAAGYTLVRTRCFPGISPSSVHEPIASEDGTSGALESVEHGNLTETRAASLSLTLCVIGALLLGVALGAVQWIPTWELKQRSQRQSSGEFHRLDFGQIPVASWGQLVGWAKTDEQGWMRWHHPLTHRDQLLRDWGAHTNQVEAHLYVGMLPLACCVGLVVLAFRWRRWEWLVWPGSAAFAVVYATGSFAGLTAELPGFGYFQGPGRFTVLTALSAGIATGICWQLLLTSQERPQIHARFRGLWWSATVLALLAATAQILLATDSVAMSQQAGIGNPFVTGGEPISIDGWNGILTLVWGGTAIFGCCSWAAGFFRNRRRPLRTLIIVGWCVWSLCLSVEYWVIGRLITYSPMVSDPPIAYRAESELFQKYAASVPPVRVLAPGGNMLSVTGMNVIPPYLTFGPEQYVSELRWLADLDVLQLSRESIDRLESIGTTHVLSLSRLEPDSPDLRLVWSGSDRLVGRALNHGRKPLYLYAIVDAPGRVIIESLRANQRLPEAQMDWVRFVPNELILEVAVSEASRIRMFELDYPGWQVTVDGVPFESAGDGAGLSSDVEVDQGRHRIHWKYLPASLYWGCAVSAVAMCVVLGAGLRQVQTSWAKRRKNNERHDS